MEALEFLALVVPFLIMVYFACLLFIRPPRQVFWRSLLAGLIVGVINLVGDVIAYQAHWWHYTFAAVALQKGASPLQRLVADLFAESMATLHVPLPFYLTPILIFGSLIFLLVWRFWPGRSHWFALLLLVGVPIFCIVRDILGGMQKTSYQMWENMPAAIAMTIVMWLVAYALGFWIFWRTAAQFRFVPAARSAITGDKASEQGVRQSL